MASRSQHQLKYSLTKRLQRRLVSYSALGIFGIGIVVAAASFIPLLDQLKQDREENLLHMAETKAIAIEQFLLRTQETAMQVTSRTRIRQELEAYNRGEISIDELVEFSASKLLEALNHSEEIAAIARYDITGEQVVQVGLPVAPDLWITPPQATTSVAISDPFLHTDGNFYLLAQAPIINAISQEYTSDG